MANDPNFDWISCKVVFSKNFQDAKSKGARVLNAAAGGGHRDRSLFAPAVVYPVTAEMQLWTAEQFGPVIPIVSWNEKCVSFKDG